LESLLEYVAGLTLTVNVQQYEYVTQAGDTAGIVVGILPQQQMPFPDDDDVITSWSAFCRSSRCLSPTTTTSSHRGRHSAAAADAFLRGRRHHIVVGILPQQQMPFPEDDGIVVSPGHATSIALVEVLKCLANSLELHACRH